MVATYSQESSIEQAFRETFGGDRPCELCKVIEAVEDVGQANDSGFAAPKQFELKLMLGLGRSIIVPKPDPSGRVADAADVFGGAIIRQVPTPPPRWMA